MGAYYDEIEIEDMVWDAEKRVYHYPCPCGDRFEISKKQLKNYEDVATCPSCSLIIRVIYDPLDFEDEPSDDEDEGEEASEEEEEEEDDDDDQFEDALDKLTLEDTPNVPSAAQEKAALVAVAA
ncbi:diphthamide biosynthesis protein 3 [Coprinopsis cinerea okayama7|uniref:Diphthamide biosynthesis protein 3 n=1 Tax=Coprinopsis cinerea (strain Okayama-7 / 130 / ATCC MYA-4618 / FGSC 9003) TaxID=240176 RepID=A8P2J7_COPC7|nr:diphthamide biosynthesis protein 3 [Coprinopsis cinerea okayama7\|eukprot:XP_001838338.1 diphthamide biosynthesis protein 3 [Coprinopsis cinerea okayama7\